MWKSAGGTCGRVPGLLALALGSPVPAALNPGPPAGVLPPKAGSERRAVGGLDDVPPNRKSVLAEVLGTIAMA